VNDWKVSFFEWILASTISNLPGSPLPRGGRLRHLGVQYFPEIVETSESPFSPSLALNRLDDPDQTARIALLKPINANDVILHEFILASHSHITKEVTCRLQEEKNVREDKKERIGM
jgi:hypothetical protein